MYVKNSKQVGQPKWGSPSQDLEKEGHPLNVEIIRKAASLRLCLAQLFGNYQDEAFGLALWGIHINGDKACGLAPL